MRIFLLDVFCIGEGQDDGSWCPEIYLSFDGLPADRDLIPFQPVYSTIITLPDLLGLQHLLSTTVKIVRRNRDCFFLLVLDLLVPQAECSENMVDLFDPFFELIAIHGYIDDII